MVLIRQKFKSYLLTAQLPKLALAPALHRLNPNRGKLEVCSSHCNFLPGITVTLSFKKENWLFHLLIFQMLSHFSVSPPQTPIPSSPLPQEVASQLTLSCLTTLAFPYAGALKLHRTMASPSIVARLGHPVLMM